MSIKNKVSLDSNRLTVHPDALLLPAHLPRSYLIRLQRHFCNIKLE